MTMPDDNGGGMSATLGRKIGPLPMYGWLMLAGATGLIIFRLMRNNTASNSTGQSGQGTNFSSSQTSTQTNPATGDTTTSSYNAQGDGYLPGQMSWSAGPMPFQQGDVYVNLPAATSTTPTDTTTTTAPAQNTDTPPGALVGVSSHVFPGTTNITWTLGTGTTTDVKITGTSQGLSPNFTVNETVDTRGEQQGDNGGHMFVVDQVSRGVSMQYTVTPYNNGMAGPSSNLTVTNAT